MTDQERLLKSYHRSDLAWAKQAVEQTLETLLFNELLVNKGLWGGGSTSRRWPPKTSLTSTLHLLSGSRSSTLEPTKAASRSPGRTPEIQAG